MLPFHPEKNLAPIAVTAAAGPTPLGLNDLREILVTSLPGNPLIFIKFGDAGVAATVNDLPILPGSAQTFHVSEPVMSTIAASGTGTLYVSIGRGI